jgi:hypothetical protein
MRQLIFGIVIGLCIACVPAAGQSGWLGSLQVREFTTDNLICGVLFRSAGVRGFSCVRK